MLLAYGNEGSVIGSAVKFGHVVSDAFVGEVLFPHFLQQS
jgi:hypothetical protein